MWRRLSHLLLQVASSVEIESPHIQTRFSRWNGVGDIGGSSAHMWSWG